MFLSVMILNVLVIVAAALIFSFNLNSFPLHNWDEAWYGEITKNMVSGQYSLLVPFWNGQYYFDKPPLYFWLSWPFFKFFGPGEWQARIVSVLAAILATWLVYSISKKLFDLRTALLSVTVFLSLGQVVTRFSQGNLDALLVCLFLASFYFHLLSQKKKRYFVLSGIFVGLGFLVKGWLLGLFPLFLISVYSLLGRRKFPLVLIPIFAIVVFVNIWWSLLGFKEFGLRFVEWYLFHPAAGYGQNNLGFSGGLLRHLVSDTGLWIVPLVISLFSLNKLNKERRGTIFSFLVVITSFIFSLHFLSQQFNWYLLPVYPLMSIIVGYVVGRLLEVKFKIFLILFLLLVVGQVYLLLWKDKETNDRSMLMANLGKKVRQLVPEKDMVILDDPDFSSFLFYSDHKQIYSLSDSEPDKREWWIVNKKDLSRLLNADNNVWLISPNVQSLFVNLSSYRYEKVTFSEGYSFIKFQNSNKKVDP